MGIMEQKSYVHLDHSIHEVLISKGFTFLGVVEGESIYCDLSSHQSIKKTLEFLEQLTGEEWVTESDYLISSWSNTIKDIIFFRKSMFSKDYNTIKFCGKDWVEMPLNYHSCRAMFEFYKFPDGFDFSKFDTSKVTTMQYAFNHCVFSENFTLDLDTSNVQDMQYMLSNTLMKSGFRFGTKFSVSRSINTYGMFSRACFSNDFVLPESFEFELGIDDVFKESLLPYSKELTDFKTESEFFNWMCNTNRRISVF